MKGVGSWKKAVKIVLWCILGAILLLIAIVEGTLLVEKYVKKKPVPMFMGYASLIVVSGSMTPEIYKGDVVIVKKVDEYDIGDVVTYTVADKKDPVTHKIIDYGKEEGTFITKGVYNDTADAPVSRDQIAGKVVYKIPKLGIVYDWFIKGGGIIYIVSAIVVIYAAVYFWRQENTAPKDDAPKK